MTEVDLLMNEARYDYVGLWEILKKAKRLSPDDQPIQQKDTTLNFVKEMIKRGAVAVDLLSSGGCRAWENQNVDYVLSRISSEWDNLNREPNIGDIVWFDVA